MERDIFFLPKYDKFTGFRSTRSAWSATSTRVGNPSNMLNLDPRAPHGARPFIFAHFSFFSHYLDPRAPHGARPLWDKFCGICKKNLDPRAPHGARRVWLIFYHHTGGIFRSTRSAWSATLLNGRELCCEPDLDPRAPHGARHQ